MTMSTRDRWLDEGIAVLREGGAAALRADRLARRLGLTKGSFHHHFAGMPDYRSALLARCRGTDAAALATVRATVLELPPAEAIAALPRVAGALQDVPLDAALRGWAVEDAEARAAVDAMDAERLAFLEELWLAALGDPAAARAAALIPHLIAVGASVTSGVSRDDLAAVFGLLSRLAPAVGPNDAAPAR